MCILLKLDYAEFGVSNLCFQNLSKKNLWRGVGGEGEGVGAASPGKLCSSTYDC